MDLVTLLEPAQDADGVLDRRFTDVDLLEPTLECRILLDVLAVLLQRGGTDEPQLPARQHRLDHVARVHRGLTCGTGTDDGVHLVDECDDLPSGVLDVVQDGLEAFLELAPILRTGDHRTEVEGDHGLPAQALRHVTGDDALRKTLDDGSFADAGFTDEHRVVLGSP